MYIHQYKHTYIYIYIYVWASQDSPGPPETSRWIPGTPDDIPGPSERTPES